MNRAKVAIILKNAKFKTLRFTLCEDCYFVAYFVDRGWRLSNHDSVEIGDQMRSDGVDQEIIVHCWTARMQSAGEVALVEVRITDLQGQR